MWDDASRKRSQKKTFGQVSEHLFQWQLVFFDWKDFSHLDVRRFFLLLPILFIDALKQSKRKKRKCVKRQLLLVSVYYHSSSSSPSSYSIFLTDHFQVPLTHARARSIMCEKIFDCIRCNVCHQTAEVRTNGSLQWIYFLRKENFVLYCMQMRDGWMDEDSWKTSHSLSRWLSCSDLLSDTMMSLWRHSSMMYRRKRKSFAYVREREEKTSFDTLIICKILFTLIIMIMSFSRMMKSKK